MILTLLLLLMVDSDDSNVVTLLIQPPSMQSRGGDNMIRPYSWIPYVVGALYGQMVEVNSHILACIKMISTSLCCVGFFLLIEQFIRLRRSLFFRLMLTFAYCLHGFLRDQNFQTDRIPLTDITVLLYELWAVWPSMTVGNLRNDKSGSADLLTSAMNGSQPRIHDGIPRTTRCRLSFLPCSQILSSSVDSYRKFGRAGRRSHVSPSCVTICRPLLSCLLRRHRSLRHLHLRLTVLSLCTESRYGGRATPG